MGRNHRPIQTEKNKEQLSLKGGLFLSLFFLLLVWTSNPRPFHTSSQEHATLLTPRLPRKWRLVTWQGIAATLCIIVALFFNSIAKEPERPSIDTIPKFDIDATYDNNNSGQIIPISDYNFDIFLNINNDGVTNGNIRVDISYSPKYNNIFAEQGIPSFDKNWSPPNFKIKWFGQIELDQKIYDFSKYFDVSYDKNRNVSTIFIKSSDRPIFASFSFLWFNAIQNIGFESYKVSIRLGERIVTKSMMDNLINHNTDGISSYSYTVNISPILENNYRFVYQEPDIAEKYIHSVVDNPIRIVTFRRVDGFSDAESNYYLVFEKMSAKRMRDTFFISAGIFLGMAGNFLVGTLLELLQRPSKR